MKVEEETRMKQIIDKKVRPKNIKGKGQLKHEKQRIFVTVAFVIVKRNREILFLKLIVNNY